MFKIIKSMMVKPGAKPASPDSNVRTDADILEERIAKLNAGKSSGPAEAATARSTETREAERFVPRHKSTVLSTANGRKHHGRIINVSTMAVAIDADFSVLDPEEVVMIGTRRVEPGRPMMRGMVFRFEKPLDPALCGPDLVL